MEIKCPYQKGKTCWNKNNKSKTCREDNYFNCKYYKGSRNERI